MPSASGNVTGWCSTPSGLIPSNPGRRAGTAGREVGRESSKGGGEENSCEGVDPVGQWKFAPGLGGVLGLDLSKRGRRTEVWPTGFKRRGLFGDDGSQYLQMTPRFPWQGKRARVGAYTGLIKKGGKSNIGKIVAAQSHQIASTRSSNSPHWSPSHSPSFRSSFCPGFGLEAHPAANVKAQSRMIVFKRFARMWEIKHFAACHSRLFFQRRARVSWQSSMAQSSA